MRSRRWKSLIGALALLLSACTTIPDESAPSAVRVVGAAGSVQQPASSPPPGASATEIVQDFLNANGDNDPNHDSARAFLTAGARSSWSDAKVTVLDNSALVSNSPHGNVVVSGNVIGTIDATGVYTPDLVGDGSGTGGVPFSQAMALTREKGELRINGLAKGLIITAAQFQAYQQRAVYFFDDSGTRLVPDLRYTQLVEPHDLVTWLVSQLALGPRPTLTTLTTFLPDQTDPKRVRVVKFPSSDGEQAGPITVDVPGASQLDANNLDRFAAELDATIAQVVPSASIEITDGSVPVRIPAAHGTTFFAGQMQRQFTLPTPASELFFVKDGGIYRGSGRPLAGRMGNGYYHLTSAALTARPSPASLQIAAVHGVGKHQILDVGTAAGLTPTKVEGDLSRPAWAPDQDEVWIGAGTTLYRVSAAGVAHAVPLEVPGGKALGTVTAVRLSPEGARVAIVLTTDGTSQAFIGSVVRSSNGVRVAGLTPISPQSISVTDIAWYDQSKLFAIGTFQHGAGFGVYEVQSDGSLWTPKPSGLPQAPDSVTVAVRQLAVVSTGPTIERQDAGQWDALLGDETRGTNPIYLE